VSEEDCGVVTAAVRERLAELGNRDPAKFVMADSRDRIGSFRNVCLKPNLKECLRWSKWDFVPETVEEECRIHVKMMANQLATTVFCTAGQEGIIVGAPSSVPARVQSFPVTGPIDVCGAGDSCSAGITCAMLAGATPEEAAAFGNLVASITIQQVGVTGTATPEQVRARWREVGY